MGTSDLTTPTGRVMAALLAVFEREMLHMRIEASFAGPASSMTAPDRFQKKSARQVGCPRTASIGDCLSGGDQADFCTTAFDTRSGNAQGVT